MPNEMLGKTNNVLSLLYVDSQTNKQGTYIQRFVFAKVGGRR